MRRVLLTPRWLGVHAAVTALVAAFIALGFWQLQRARAEAEPATPQADRSAVPITSLAKPGELMPADAVGRLVTVSGQYDTGQQFLVDRREARWVVTLLRTAGGAGIPVVRGSTDEQPPLAPVGEVTVTGWLQPSENGTIGDGAINTAELIQHVPYDLYDGYLVLASQAPPPTDPLQTVRPVRTSADKPGFPLQNTAYAIQWWLFAGFAIFIWWRTVRDAVRRRTDPLPATSRPPIPAQKQPVDE